MEHVLHAGVSVHKHPFMLSISGHKIKVGAIVESRVRVENPHITKRSLMPASQKSTHGDIQFGPILLDGCSTIEGFSSDRLYPIKWVDQRLLAECIQLNMCVELIARV